MTVTPKTVSRQLKLSLMAWGFASYHVAGWRNPSSYVDAGSNFQRWLEIARKAENAKFDMLFLADAVAPMEIDNPKIFAKSPYADRFEPITLLSALAAVTNCLGLAATASTTYRPPYDLARAFASLDLISGGRAGWNVVTGLVAADAAQYSDQLHVAKAERYARCEEYVDVVTALWSSVEPDALPRDQKSGVYADPSKFHLINHKGKYFAIKGPLSVLPSPQERPILIQAGQSPEGRALSSRIADVIFTSQSSLELAKDFRADMTKRASGFGRDPDAIKIMPGLMIIVGETEKEAEEKHTLLNSLVDSDVALWRMQIENPSIDWSKYDLDAPFPDFTDAPKDSRTINFIDMARRDNLTLRQVMMRSSVSNAHLTLKGTPVQIVDKMEEWLVAGAADGFNLLCHSMPAALDDIIALILPELRRRGLFRTEYEGSTLRENLGVPMAPIPKARQPA